MSPSAGSQSWVRLWMNCGRFVRSWAMTTSGWRSHGDAAAGPVGPDQVGHRGAATHEPLGHAGHQRGTGRVDEDLLVARRQRVAASLGVGGRVVDVDERGDGLLLEPLARVARGDAGRGGELGGGQRTALGQRPVEAELGAEVDRQQVERAERGLEQASDEGVAALGRVLGCGHRHGVSPGRVGVVSPRAGLKGGA